MSQPQPLFQTAEVQKALLTAARLHDGQFRKGPQRLPYITHPLSVAALIQEHTDDVDILCAALLHDTIEDTPYLPEEMIQDFGEHVTRTVLGVTIPETLAYKRGTIASVPKDRTAYIQNLRDGDTAVRIVAAADKIHNFESIIIDFGGVGGLERYLATFGRSAEARVLLYDEVVDAILHPGDIPAPLAHRLKGAWHAYREMLSTQS